MKRSEAIQIISQYLITDRINPPLDNYDQERARLDAEELLTLLESRGMQPPKIQQYVLPNGQSELSYMEWINKWED